MRIAAALLLPFLVVGCTFEFAFPGASLEDLPQDALPSDSPTGELDDQTSDTLDRGGVAEATELDGTPIPDVASEERDVASEELMDVAPPTTDTRGDAIPDVVPPVDTPEPDTRIPDAPGGPKDG